MGKAGQAQFIVFGLLALSLLLLRSRAAFIRLLFHRPRGLWIVTAVVIAGWAGYTGAWHSLDWGGVLYFLFVGFIVFTGLAILWEVHKALKRWTNARR
jgi:amino acid transporter